MKKFEHHCPGCQINWKAGLCHICCERCGACMKIINFQPDGFDSNKV